MTKKKKSPSKAQLLEKIDRLEKKLRRGHEAEDARQLGEHWYELREVYDPSSTLRLPSPMGEGTFLRGMLEGIYIVEVPATSTPQQIRDFQAMLVQNGLEPALIVLEGVRFLKLAAVDAEKEAELDAVQAAPTFDLDLGGDAPTDPS